MINELKEKIIKESKRIEEDALYSSKGHFYASECWTNINFWVGSISAILAAIAGASALSQFDYHNIVAGCLSIIVSCLTAIMTFISPNEKATAHRNAGNKYNALKNDVRIFYDIEINELSDQKIVNSLKKLNNRKDKLNAKSSQIPKWAFEKARKGIEDGEARYRVDENK